MCTAAVYTSAIIAGSAVNTTSTAASDTNLLYFCNGGCYGSLRSVGYPVQGVPFDGASELLEDRDDQQKPPAALRSS